MPRCRLWIFFHTHCTSFQWKSLKEGSEKVILKFEIVYNQFIYAGFIAKELGLSVILSKIFNKH